MNEIQQEIVPISAEDLFIILNHPNASFDYSVHCHPEYEINLVTGCSGTRIVGDSEEAFSGSDLVMIGPLLPHAWKSDAVSNHVITIQFSGDMLNYPILGKRLFSPIRQLLMDSSRGLSFEGAERKALEDQIVALTKMQGFQSATTFLGILNMMANSSRQKLVSNMFEPEEIVRSSKSRRIAKVCEYIEKNHKEDIRLADVAALVNMSGSAFSHFFKKRTGISYITYLNNLRVTHACNLLESTTLSASEICYECGFNNKSNFIRIFTRKKGMTPIQYRKFITQMLIKY